MTLITIFIVLLFLHSLFSSRLERTVFTPPILFTAAGMLTLLLLPELRDRKANIEIFLRVAEVGLTLLLFTDASRTDLKVLKHIRNLPARLLSVGMLLTLLLGALAALVVFRQLSIWEAGILAAILAPTDAGLGQIIVNSPRVPMKIRQALNVEAGLNDGLSVPFLLFFIALAAPNTDGHSASLLRFIMEQLGYGAIIGAGIGLVGGWLLGWVGRNNWMAESSQQLGVVALPLFCMVASEAAEASMFIAAFVAGLAVQVKFKEAGKHSVEFTEEWGQLFNLSVFFLFGLLVARDWQLFNWSHVLYAVISLTVVRMLPVAVALIGTRLSRATILFMGWFGPRGLASIVLGLVFLEQGTHQPGEATIRLAVMMTVLLSIFAHGFSALPGINFYAAKVATLKADAPENQEIGAKLAARNQIG
jgi:sodium/hydrogen antiporter